MVTAESQIEGRARGKAQAGRQLKPAQLTRRAKSAGRRKAMTAIEQAARNLMLKISRRQRIGSIHDAVVFQEGKGVDGAKRKARATLLLSKAVTHFQSQTVIETIADGNQLLDFTFCRIEPQKVQPRQPPLQPLPARNAVQTHHVYSHPTL